MEQELTTSGWIAFWVIVVACQPGSWLESLCGRVSGPVSTPDHLAAVDRHCGVCAKAEKGVEAKVKGRLQVRPSRDHDKHPL